MIVSTATSIIITPETDDEHAALKALNLLSREAVVTFDPGPAPGPTEPAHEIGYVARMIVDFPAPE